MSANYIFRLDDITPNIDWDHFGQIMDLFRIYNIKPLLGIVPDNKDIQLIRQDANPDFWDIMRDLQRTGMVEFSQHGYQHILGNKRSEFVGLPYEVQFNKIKAGQDILRREGIYTDIWMSPAHTFDAITLNALTDLGFSAVTDGIALYPFKKNGLTFVPQQLWRPRLLPFGVFTICLHLNEKHFYYHKIEFFLKSKPCVISFSNAKYINGSVYIKPIDKLFKVSYFILVFIKRMYSYPFSKKLLRITKNFLYDIQFGSFLGGTKKTPFAHIGAYDTANSDYAVLPSLFLNRIRPSDILVDVGCGKGRVINWWLKQGLRNKMIGLELDPEIARVTAKRLRKYINVSIIVGDAIKNIPINGTIFYLYNPFDEHLMEIFKKRLLKVFAKRKNVLIVYYNCIHVDLYKNDPKWMVKELDLGKGFHKAAIIKML